MRLPDDPAVESMSADRPAPEHLAQFVLEGGGEDRALLLVSVDGRIIGTHGAAEAVLGADIGQPGREFASLLATSSPGPAQRPRLIEQILLGRSVRRRCWCLRSDRSRFWGEVMAAPVLAANGAVIGAAIAIRDLTELKAAETASKQRTRAARPSETETIHAAMLDGITNAFFAIDEEWRFVYVNARCAQMLRKPREQLLGGLIWDEMPVQEGSPFHRQLQQAAAEGMPVQFEEYYPLLNSWFEVHAYPYAGGVVVYFWDISDRKLEIARIRQQSLHDPLTGVPNMLLLQDRLGTSIARAGRNGTTLALLRVDIDGLGRINQQHGHGVGDLLLQTAARRLTRDVRRSDTIARLAGDEFGILTNDHHDADGPAVFAEKLLANMSELFELTDASIEMTASIGIALFPNDGHDVEALMQAADAALAAAKESGGNTYRFYAPELSQEVLRRRAVEGELRSAITTSEFELWYQPERALEGEAVTAMEALVRWTRPGGRSETAAEFMSALYATEVTAQFDHWVLREACRDRARWSRAGVTRLPVTVNIAPNTLSHGGLVAMVREVLAEAGLEPGLLELEFAQPALERVEGDLAATFAELRNLGVTLSLDGVGQNGWAAVAAVERYPINKVKFDQQIFTASSGIDREAAIRAASSFAHAMKRRVIAERIESAGQLDFVRTCGFDGVQGSYVGKAVQPHNAFASAAP